MTNKLGLNPRENEFKIYLNKPVRVGIMSNGSAMGIVDCYTTEYLHLKPSLVHHGTYGLDGKLINHAVIEANTPQKVKISNISHIEPLKEGYIEHLAQNLNQTSKPSKIILPYLNIK